ncbi:hypothetical protein CN689_14275 [Peribacillus butanolivorans]|uniref:Uncharacterized protein n=1 Tax=Peribacillus butanolivorans TaxID=421767 RepID=A0AAX0S3L0_9BACI|nr:hypothetical protein [Peribacillus butanolivorans]PEJ32292.1 hypothetical protein CN689_14275 [Peribacillus butanolivorans]
MKPSRLGLLKKVYDEAVKFNTMQSGLNLRNKEGYVDNVFDYEYLKAKRYITLTDDKGGLYACITCDGIEVVEDALEDKKDKLLCELKLDGRKLAEMMNEEIGRILRNKL